VGRSSCLRILAQRNQVCKQALGMIRDRGSNQRKRQWWGVEEEGQSREGMRGGELETREKECE